MRIILLTINFGWLIITDSGRLYKSIRLALLSFILVLILGLKIHHNHTVLSFTHKFGTAVSAHVKLVALILISIVVLGWLIKKGSSFGNSAPR